MPIRPELKPLYPSNWREISNAIRFDRAQGKCEFCGVRHGWYRGQNGVVWEPSIVAELSLLESVNFSRIILTTAHLDHDPTNNAEENLRALCQKCHLAHDLPHHLISRRINRERETGQGRLFPREDPHEIA